MSLAAAEISAPPNDLTRPVARPRTSAWQLFKDVLDHGGPGYLQFAITNICNADCAFCGFARSQFDPKQRHSVTLQDAKDVVDIARRNHIGYLLFVGGEPMVRRIVDRFYDIMDSAPEAASIRALHARDLTAVRERLFEFLSGWLGGPPLYFQRPDHKCIMSAHRPFPIGAAERDAWMMCMRRALADCGLPADYREVLEQAFQRMAEAFRNR